MIVKYLQISGFEFKNPEEKVLLEQILINQNANLKLTQMVNKIQGDELELIPKKLQVLDYLKKKRKKAQQRLQQLKTKKESTADAIEKLIDRLSQLWPNLSKCRQELKSQYSLVLQFGSQQDSKCGLSQLTQYLKLEKAQCQQIANLLEQQPAVSCPSSMHSPSLPYLHSLLQSRRYQSILKLITLKKLQAQIQFMEENVVMGDLLVYNAKLKEEEGVKEELKGELEELKKVLRISGQGCERGELRQAEQMVSQQYRRQMVVYEMLAQETQEIAQEIQATKPAEMLSHFKLESTDTKPIIEVKPKQPRVYSHTIHFPDIQTPFQSVKFEQSKNQLKELEGQIEQLQAQVQKLQTSCKKSK